MITQPPLKVVHPPLEVWQTQITTRPFVVHHHIGRNAEETQARVHFHSSFCIRVHSCSSVVKN